MVKKPIKIHKEYVCSKCTDRGTNPGGYTNEFCLVTAKIFKMVCPYCNCAIVKREEGENGQLK